MLDFSIESIINYLYCIPGVLYALSIHELCHGYVAYKLGDPTAKNYGRLTLNPAKHIDVIGLIAMFVVGVGWAKPVPVNTRYFKKPKRDMALTALAGPLSNMLSAILGMFVYIIFAFSISFASVNIPTAVLDGLIIIFQNFIVLNIGLAIFNLIPIPPLDGSRILDSFLPPKALILYHKYEDIVRIVLLVVLILDIVSISPLVYSVYSGMLNIVMRICYGIFDLFI